jgi:hypothetical protein
MGQHGVPSWGSARHRENGVGLSGSATPGNAARADVFDYIERFYNPSRRHSTLGNLSPIAFERAAVLNSLSTKPGTAHTSPMTGPQPDVPGALPEFRPVNAGSNDADNSIPWIHVTLEITRLTDAPSCQGTMESDGPTKKTMSFWVFGPITPYLSGGSTTCTE